MASHAFIISWMLSPRGNAQFGVNWNAGTELGGHGSYGEEGNSPGCSVTITGCNSHGISYSKSGEFGKGGSHDEGVDGPEVYVWFENRTTKQVIGGFLDHSRSSTSSRDFNNIKDLWHMSPSAILAQAGRVQMALKGDKGHAKSEWFNLGSH